MSCSRLHDREDTAAGGLGHALGRATIQGPGVVGFNECRREPVVLNGGKGSPQERVYDNLESLILWGLAWAKGFSPVV